MKPAMPVSKTVSYCAPLRYAQACGARKDYLLSLPSIYEPVCAQEPRPHWLDMLGYYLSPLSGLVLRQSKGLTRTLPESPFSLGSGYFVLITPFKLLEFLFQPPLGSSVLVSVVQGLAF